MVTDGNCEDHFVTYRNTESLCCVSGTNSVLGQLNFNKNFKNVYP